GPLPAKTRRPFRQRWFSARPPLFEVNPSLSFLRGFWPPGREHLAGRESRGADNRRRLISCPTFGTDVPGAHPVFSPLTSINENYEETGLTYCMKVCGNGRI